MVHRWQSGGETFKVYRSEDPRQIIWWERDDVNAPDELMTEEFARHIIDLVKRAEQENAALKAEVEALKRDKDGLMKNLGDALVELSNLRATLKTIG